MKNWTFLLIAIGAMMMQSCQPRIDLKSIRKIEVASYAIYSMDENPAIYYEKDDGDYVEKSCEDLDVVIIETDTYSKYIEVRKTKIEDGTGVTRKVLKVGDSLTNGHVSIRSLIKKFSKDPMNVEFVGTQDSAPFQNEGYPGKDFNWFANHEDSPFVFNGELDFEKYLYTNQINLLDNDWVIFQLGTNDIFGWDGCDQKYLAGHVALQNLVASIQSVDVQLRIGITTIDNKASQDYPWEIIYNNGLAAKTHFNECKESWNDQIVKDWKNSSNIHFIPLHMALNPDSDFPADDYGVQINAVHPSESGYHKIANYYYYFLKYFQ